MSIGKRAVGLCLLSFLTGCASLVRESVNRSHPPVFPTQRQLAAIRGSQDNLEHLLRVDATAFLQADLIEAYVNRALAGDLPLDDETKKKFAEAVQIGGTSTTLDQQEVQIAFDVGITLVSKVKLGVHASIHAVPEFRGASGGSAVLLRISATNLQVLSVDLRDSKFAGWNGIASSRVVIGLVNEAIRVIEPNINEQIQNLRVPVVFAPVIAGVDPKEAAEQGITVDPPTVAAIQPQLREGVVFVSKAGIGVIGVADFREMTPEEAEAWLPPQMAAEAEVCLPAKPTKAELDSAFHAFEEKFTQRMSSFTGTVPGAKSELRALSSRLAAMINSSLGPKRVRITLRNPIERHAAQSDDEKNITMPHKIDLYCDQLRNMDCSTKEVCTTFFESKANDLARSAKSECDRLQGELDKLKDKLDCGKCCADTFLGEVCEPTCKLACEAAKATAGGIQGSLDACRLTLGAVEFFRQAKEEHLPEFADKIGLGQYYKTVCRYYNGVLARPECEATKLAGGEVCNFVQDKLRELEGDRIATFDWFYEGDGDAALSAFAELSNLAVTPNLQRASLHINASGSARIKGGGIFTVTDLVQPICPTHPQGNKIELKPVDLGAVFIGQDVSATFSTSQFKDKGLVRNGMFVDVEPVNVSLVTSTAPIVKLLQENNVVLPCALNGYFWSQYLLVDFLAQMVPPLILERAVDPPPLRVGATDNVTKLPVKWAIDPKTGKTVVTDTLPLRTEVSFSDTQITYTLGELPPAPPNAPPPTGRPVLITVATGLGVGELVNTDHGEGGNNQFGRGLTWLNPYLQMNIASRKFGLLLGPGTGFGEGATGFLLAGSYRFIHDEHMSISVYGGTRWSSVAGLKRWGDPRPAIGIAIEMGRLCVWGCYGRRDQ